MGLPMWTDPEKKAAAVKVDATAAARSSIRRRPSIHGPRSHRRDSRAFAPRLERSPPPPVPTIRANSRFSRRNGRAGVPPISTLLESADRRIPPPAPVPRARNYFSQQDEAPTLSTSLASLRDQTERLSQRAREFAATAGSEDERNETAARELVRIDRRIWASSERIRYLTELNTRNARTIQRSATPATTRSQVAAAAARDVLPTPPLDALNLDGDSLFLPENNPPRSQHPLSHSWQPDSPMPLDGLGDRNRSPTPQDTWSIMRSTIAPDTTLPSASSSFTSAAASASFTTSAPASTDSAPSPATSVSEQQGDEVESCASSDDDEEDADMLRDSAEFAQAMYQREQNSLAGRERIAIHRAAQLHSGPVFTLRHEPDSIDLGFRLMEAALQTDHGRDNLLGLSDFSEAERPSAEEAVARMLRFRDQRIEEPGSPFSFTEQSPTRDHDFRHAIEGELSDETDLGAMRRVVERLARRRDVPEEFWISMGLNFSQGGTRRRTEDARL